MNTNEEFDTVKGWAEKAGLKLDNYDGFVEIYEKLTKKISNTFYETVATRFRNAGELLCTRKAFETYVKGCTMHFPKLSQLEKMSDIIPNFAESSINGLISADIGKLSHYSLSKDEIRTTVKDMLDLLKQKENARKKSIEIYGSEEIDIINLDLDNLNENQINIIKNYHGTIEGLETQLFSEITQDLEKLLQKNNIKLPEILLDKLRTLTSLLYSTQRQKTNDNLDGFMYVNIPGQDREQFIKPYYIMGTDEIRSGVAFDFNTVRGAMATTPDVDATIREHINSKAPVLSADSVLTSLETIDKQIKPEERKGLLSRLKEIVKSFFSTKGKKER